MDSRIRRVQPEAAIQSQAARAIGPRRERGAKREDEFADELARHAEQDGPGGTSERHEESNDEHPSRTKPLDGETGSRLDVTG